MRLGFSSTDVEKIKMFESTSDMFVICRILLPLSHSIQENGTHSSNQTKHNNINFVIEIGTYAFKNLRTVVGVPTILLAKRCSETLE